MVRNLVQELEGGFEGRLDQLLFEHVPIDRFEELVLLDASDAVRAAPQASGFVHIKQASDQVLSLKTYISRELDVLK